MKCARPSCRTDFAPRRNRRYCSDRCAQAIKNDEGHRSYEGQRESALMERFTEAVRKDPTLENWQLVERFGINAGTATRWRALVSTNTTAAHREG